MSVIYMGNIADFTDPDDPQGRSYRQINAEKKHNIPIGTLVEIESGVRLFVVYHARDCDQTPLYCLSIDKDDTEMERPDQGLYNASWDCGYPEDALVVVKPGQEAQHGGEGVPE